MISVTVIIPIFIIACIVFQMLELVQGPTNCSDEPKCITSDVFGWLALVSEFIILIMLGILGFCYLDFETGKKRSNKAIVSSVCTNFFIRYYNSLLVLIPLAIAFYIISFSTKTEDYLTDVSSSYIPVIIILVASLILHPAITQAK